MEGGNLMKNEYGHYLVLQLGINMCYNSGVIKAINSRNYHINNGL